MQICNDKILIEISKDIEYTPIRCNSINCFYKEHIDNCSCIRNTDCHNFLKLKIAHLEIIFENLTNEPYTIREEYLYANDSDGFSIRGICLCQMYSSYVFRNTGNFDLMPRSKCRYEILFPMPRKELTISSIYYSGFDDVMTLNISELDNPKETNIDLLMKKIKNLSDENLMLKTQSEDSLSILGQRRNDDLTVRYRLEEDDVFLNLYIDEDVDSFSFNREFNKSKDNYNWINKGDALITLKAENAPFYSSSPTIIQSPVSGIFESIKNKQAIKDDLICRIRKYDQSDKELILIEMEKEDVKQNIYKKERKKMIERETLDELVSEGKIFNIYTKKDGNRDTVPMDVANAVWNRDGGKCCICGSNKELEFDHIIPISKGGATTFRNLQLLCRKCNSIKSDNI